MEIIIDEKMIAPCGMNCGLCLAHQREKKQCLGCRVDSPNKRKSCTGCSIILCDKRRGKDADFCYVCDSFPCTRMKTLDKRYRTNYNMSMFENLHYIKGHGIDAFVENEKKRWACDVCGGARCVHRDYCLVCESIKE